MKSQKLQKKAQWIKEWAQDLVTECGFTPEDAKVKAKYDYEKYVSQAGETF